MTIFTIKGIKVQINWIFLVIIFLFALVGELARALTVFTAVILHEAGHVFIAFKNGLKIKKVELLPFGGVAVFEDILEMKYSIEKKVALAGPVVNCILVLLSILLARYHILNINSALFFITCNLYIAIFNLIPALPLDGGRIMRAVMTPFLGYWKATHFTLRMTKILAIIVGGWAFFMWMINRGSILSLMGAFFVYFAALKEEEESVFVLLKYLMRKKTRILKEGILPGEQFLVLNDTLIFDVLKVVNPGAFAHFLICDKQYQFLGILSEIEVMEAFFEQGKNIPINQLLVSK